MRTDPKSFIPLLEEKLPRFINGSTLYE